MKLSKHEIAILKDAIKKIEEKQNKEKIHISVRKKSQLKGKTINKRIQKKSRPTVKRRPTKKRSSIR